MSSLRNDAYLATIIKQFAVDAVNAQVPVNITYGTVVSISPLNVMVDQKLILQPVHLEVVKSLSDYQVEVDISGVTQTATIKNGLKVNDKVVMLRFPGGKRFLVVDRV